MLSLEVTWVGMSTVPPMWHSPTWTLRVSEKLTPIFASPTEILSKTTFVMGFSFVPCSTRAAFDALLHVRPSTKMLVISEK